MPKEDDKTLNSISKSLEEIKRLLQCSLIFQLSGVGLSQPDIAKNAKISLNTVNKMLKSAGKGKSKGGK